MGTSFSRPRKGAWLTSHASSQVSPRNDLSSNHTPHQAPHDVQGPQRLVYEWTHGLPAAEDASAQELRGHAHLYLKFLDPSHKSRSQLLSSAVLPEERFRDMYRAFCDEDLSENMDPYTMFTNVLAEYGERLDPGHTIIDFTVIGLRMGLSPSHDPVALETSYYSFVAPLVALWLMEVELVVRLVDIDREFGSHELTGGFPSRTTLKSLDGALMSVANLLGLPNACDAISMLPSSTMEAADNVGCKNWLLQVATNDDLRRVACELSHRPRRFLIDWLDDVLSSNDPILDEPFLFRLFVDMVRSSGDFPTRLWVSTDGPITPRTPHFFGGGHGLCETFLGGEPCIICVPLPSGYWDSEWAVHQDLYEALAVTSKLRHPNLLTLLGVTYFPGHSDMAPYHAAFILPRIPEVHYQYPFVGSLPLRIDDAMIQIASSLKYLHARGVVHGDITWQNVFIRPNNTLGLWNFGFKRMAFHELTEPYRRFFFNPPRTTIREPNMADDIYCCAMLFLSLALAVPGASSDFGSAAGVCSRFSIPQLVETPQMPPLFANVDYVAPAQRFMLWQLIIDMAWKEKRPAPGMKEVLNRLCAIFTT